MFHGTGQNKGVGHTVDPGSGEDFLSTIFQVDVWDGDPLQLPHLLLEPDRIPGLP